MSYFGHLLGITPSDRRPSYQIVGFLLPVVTFIPVLVLLNKTEEKK